MDTFQDIKLPFIEQYSVDNQSIIVAAAATKSSEIFNVRKNAVLNNSELSSQMVWF